MHLVDFHAENDFERAIVSAKQSRHPMSELLALMADSDLYVSSKGEVQRDGSGFDPLLLSASGESLVAAFSAPSRPGLHARVAQYFLQMKGRDLLLRLPPGYGIILNPGYVAQLIIPVSATLQLRNSLRA